jgi:hypothetical protein
MLASTPENQTIQAVTPVHCLTLTQSELMYFLEGSPMGEMALDRMRRSAILHTYTPTRAHMRSHAHAGCSTSPTRTAIARFSGIRGSPSSRTRSKWSCSRSCRRRCAALPTHARTYTQTRARADARCHASIRTSTHTLTGTHAHTYTHARIDARAGAACRGRQADLDERRHVRPCHHQSEHSLCVRALM